jgi:FtsZ-binding cell division protein ZapB
MMRMSRLQIALVLGLGVALLASTGIIVFQSRRLAEFERQREADLQSLREIRETLRQSELRNAAASAKPRTPSSEDQAAIAQRDATIELLNSEISQARSDVSILQKQLSDARDESQETLTSTNQHYQKLQADWQSRLDAVQKELSATQVEVQNSRQRVAELEKANAKLTSESGANSARAVERERVLASLQDLDRRRESYLTSIADRYRDLTNRFRTMSGMLDSNRSSNSNSFSGAALELIQNAISLTDNDLQHLNELNARAFRLQKKLEKK